MENTGFERIENNIVSISGEIVSDFAFSHEFYGEKFYTAYLSTKRTSGAADVVPITVFGRLADVKADWKGRYVKICGQFRSYNKHTDSGNRLVLSIFARKIEALQFLPDENYIYLDGYICKEPNYRETPLGREIVDLFLAVNRSYGKSDYIPCICWGRNAKFVGKLDVGTRIAVNGRIQSREYQKRISETEIETRTAYEVSVSTILRVEESNENE